MSAAGTETANEPPSTVGTILHRIHSVRYECSATCTARYGQKQPPIHVLKREAAHPVFDMPEYLVEQRSAPVVRSGRIVRMNSLSAEQLQFIQRRRVARLATADRTGAPHAIPVCFACDGSLFYIALDAKPKRVAPTQLKRVRNILDNPQVALVLDHYDDDWRRLGYVLIRGKARLLPPDQPGHAVAIDLLRVRYPQYRAMPIHAQPVITIQPASVVAWGNLAG